MSLNHLSQNWGQVQLDHLTVIEIGEPIEQVATGSTAFKVEWRGNKVFLQPLEPEVATNLFIWTRSGKRFSYEVAPAERSTECISQSTASCRSRKPRLSR